MSYLSDILCIYCILFPTFAKKYIHILFNFVVIVELKYKKSLIDSLLITTLSSFSIDDFLFLNMSDFSYKCNQNPTYQNFITKYFYFSIAILNYYCMFAESNANGYFIKHNYVIAIFMAIGCMFSARIMGYLSPVGYDTCVIICSLARMGKDSLSSFYSFIFSFINANEQ